jgi:hypothetical protein
MANPYAMLPSVRRKLVIQYKFIGLWAFYLRPKVRQHSRHWVLWSVLLDVVNNFRIPCEVGNFLSRWVTGSFSPRTALLRFFTTLLKCDIPVKANKAYGDGGVTPPILNLGTRWRWVIGHTPW